MHIVKEIEEYLLYLRKECGLFITLHPMGGEYLISNSSLIQYSIHTNPYCAYLKTSPNCQLYCVKKQKDVGSKLERESCFTGICHAGVKERVWGLFLKNKYIGFISASAYQGAHETVLPRIKRISRTYAFEEENLLSAYARLSPDMPEEKKLDALILPLARMIEYGNLILSDHFRGRGDLFPALIEYLNGHFTEEISVEKLGRHFHVSISHISHTFKKNKGVSIREYITALRLNLAENLLVNTEERVTAIAYIAGFSDCPYFIRVFQKHKGMTPSVYRRTKGIEN